jgi:putative copper resistance protein D
LADPAWTLLVAVRFAHYAALTALFGLALFPLYAAGERGAPAARSRKPWLIVTAVLSLLTTGLWFAATVGEMSGAVADAAAPDVLWPVIRDMEFGHLAAARMGLGILAVALAVRRDRPWALTLVSGLLLASLAGAGHARLDAGAAGLGRIAVDALHLLAAGAWFGGLAGLASAMASLGPAPADAALTRFGLQIRGFSHMGYAAVATLVGTGLVNGVRLVGSTGALLSTAYGRLLMVKVALFLGMLALAAINRLWISPALTQPSEGLDSRPWLRSLARHVAAEQVLAVLVLAAVSWLGVLDPASGG